MKNLLICFLAFFCFPSFSSAMNGKIIEDQVFESAILGEPMLYNLYLPAGYDEKISYPVIFYLHWFGGDHHSADEFMGDIDRRISKGLFSDVIIVAPNVELHAVFHMLGVIHEFRVMDENHDGNCVNASMEEAIDFIYMAIH